MWNGIEAGKYPCARLGAGGVLVVGDWSEESVEKDPQGTWDALWQIIDTTESTIKVCDAMGGQCPPDCPVRRLNHNANIALDKLPSF